MSKLPHYTQVALGMAARYAHTRKTAASYVVVSSILHHWDELDDRIKENLIKEAKMEATCNMEDWDRLINRGV